MFSSSTRNQNPSVRAFSLVEILAAIAVIAILAALIASSVNSVRLSARQTAGAAVMRNIGSAIFLYSSEHGGRLPGPLFSNQVAVRGSSKNGFLINWLAPYLGAGDLEPGTIVQGFANPALEGHVNDLRLVSHYYLIHHPRSADGSWLTEIPLWGGHPSGSGSPLALAGVEDPGKQVILMDTDRRLVRERDFPPGLPPPDVQFDPVYVKSRNLLQLDGSVISQPVE